MPCAPPVLRLWLRVAGVGLGWGGRDPAPTPLAAAAAVRGAAGAPTPDRLPFNTVSSLISLHAHHCLGPQCACACTRGPARGWQIWPAASRGGLTHWRAVCTVLAPPPATATLCRGRLPLWPPTLPAGALVCTGRLRLVCGLGCPLSHCRRGTIPRTAPPAPPPRPADPLPEPGSLRLRHPSARCRHGGGRGTQIHQTRPAGALRVQCEAAVGRFWRVSLHRSACIDQTGFPGSSP